MHDDPNGRCSRARVQSLALSSITILSSFKAIVFDTGENAKLLAQERTVSLRAHSPTCVKAVEDKPTLQLSSEVVIGAGLFKDRNDDELIRL